MYCYCDVVLFVQAPLPKLDERNYECELVPSSTSGCILSTRYSTAKDEKDVTIQKNDIVVGIKGRRNDIIDCRFDEEDEGKKDLSFLKRPYGRPNRTPADERGWLYAQRIYSGDSNGSCEEGDV